MYCKVEYSDSQSKKMEGINWNEPQGRALIRTNTGALIRVYSLRLAMVLIRTHSHTGTILEGKH